MSRANPDADRVYRSLFEAASDAILLVDEEGKILLANAACETLLGYPPSDLQGRPVETLVPERLRLPHAHHREEYAAEPRPRPMGRGLELVARHADGHDVPVDISLAPFAVAGRTLISCAIRDLRGRSLVHDSLRLQTTALRSAANGIVITDRGGTIIWVNPAACAITGYSEQELVGQHTRILKSGQHGDDFYADLWRTIESGRTWSGTIVNRRRDGSLYHEDQTIAPVIGEDGEVTHFIAIKQDVTEQHRVRDELSRAYGELGARLREIEALNRLLREQAIRDPLTNLYNRRYLDEAISRDIAQAIRSGQPLAVAAMDLDHFKAVNDTWGHAVGDRVLQRLADVLRDHVRASDLVCRVGGEEFVVVMPAVSMEVAVRRAEQWRTAFAASSVEAGGELVRCTVSIGVAAHSGNPEETAAMVQGRADAALYAAKRAGRNQVVSAGAAMATSS